MKARLADWRQRLKAIRYVLQGNGIIFRTVVELRPDGKLLLGHYRGGKHFACDNTFNHVIPEWGEYGHTLAEVRANILARQTTVVDGGGNAFDARSW